MRCRNICERKSILKRDTKPFIKKPSVKEIFGYWTGWVGSKIVWAEVNRVKISSCVKD